VSESLAPPRSSYCLILFTMLTSCTVYDSDIYCLLFQFFSQAKKISLFITGVASARPTMLVYMSTMYFALLSYFPRENIFSGSQNSFVIKVEHFYYSVSTLASFWKQRFIILCECCFRWHVLQTWKGEAFWQKYTPVWLVGFEHVTSGFTLSSSNHSTQKSIMTEWMIISICINFCRYCNKALNEIK
jgi:hypothetical protein